MNLLQPLLISFAGAILAASLAFYVRAKLDANAIRTAELKIAYVHYVRFSQFIAVEAAIKALAQALIPVEMRDKFAVMGKPGKYEASHEICALVAAFINDEVASEKRAAESIFSSKLLLIGFIDGLKAIRLTDEQLSKLPRASVVIHFNFQELADQLSTVLKKWEFSIENNNFKWVTAEAIYEQWNLLLRLSKASREARVAMLATGVVSEKEGLELLRHQMNHYTVSISSQLLDGPKLAEAQRDFLAKRVDAT